MNLLEVDVHIYSQIVTVQSHHLFNQCEGIHIPLKNKYRNFSFLPNVIHEYVYLIYFFSNSVLIMLKPRYSYNKSSEANFGGTVCL